MLPTIEHTLSNCEDSLEGTTHLYTRVEGNSSFSLQAPQLRPLSNLTQLWEKL